VVTALLFAGTAGDPTPTWRLVAATAAGVEAAEALYRRAVARLGGGTGDVMGAMSEVSTTTVLLVGAALLS
jgi:adenosylcobinamide-GDP ribazoletransferase